MRTTVDIPDATYRRLKTKAATEGCSVKQLLLRGADAVLEERKVDTPLKPVPRLAKPLLGRGTSETLHLTNAMIDEMLNAS